MRRYIFDIPTRVDIPGNQSNQMGGVLFKVMDCRIVVSEFEVQSRIYVHFRTNALRK